MLYLLNLRKQSNQVELDQFFKTLRDKPVADQQITKSAFFQARKQLSATAFVALNHRVIEHFYSSLRKRGKSSFLRTWHGFRLTAIDGSKLRLPYEKAIVNHFGLHTGKAIQTPCAMGMMSTFYDVLNKVVIDAGLHPVETSEKACVPDHLAHADADDLTLYDRGYNAFWLYALHIQRGLRFCMRVKARQLQVAKDFIASGQSEAMVTLSPNSSSVKTCLAKGIPTTPITLRLVRVDLPNETEVLITNLMDSRAFPARVFPALYHLRWGIEENYKRIKQWAEIENFSGKSVLSVQQDFHAKIVSTNLTAMMALAAEQQSVRVKNRARVYQVNFAQALSKMKHQLVKLIAWIQDDLMARIKQTIAYIGETLEAVRKGRSYPRRVKSSKNRIHHPAYKSSL